jgi:hypothetical protein
MGIPGPFQDSYPDLPNHPLETSIVMTHKQTQPTKKTFCATDLFVGLAFVINLSKTRKAYSLVFNRS